MKETDCNPNPFTDDMPDRRKEPEKFDIYKQTLEKTAENMLRFLDAGNQAKALDDVVFSLQQSMADTNAMNPIDFSEILTVNARILNIAFGYYLDKAHESPAADHKIALAMRLQAQLTRTIDTWRRLASFENKQRGQ